MWILVLRSNGVRDYLLCETEKKVDDLVLTERLHKANLLPAWYELCSYSTSERHRDMPRYVSEEFDDRPAPKVPRAFRADRLRFLMPLFQRHA